MLFCNFFFIPSYTYIAFKWSERACVGGAVGDSLRRVEGRQCTGGWEDQIPPHKQTPEGNSGSWEKAEGPSVRIAPIQIKSPARQMANTQNRYWRE